MHPSPSEPLLVTYQLTYSPAHRANGTPLDPTASRQVLAERRTVKLQARHADAAVWTFERATDRMTTGCKRLQEIDQEWSDLEEQA
jgi:hypothetical protein